MGAAAAAGRFWADLVKSNAAAGDSGSGSDVKGKRMHGVLGRVLGVGLALQLLSLSPGVRAEPPAAPAAAGASAQTAAPPPQTGAPAIAPALPVAELGAFVDGVVRAYMREKGVAGVTVAVVDRNGTLLERGYGIAAQRPARAVDPATTLFRIGSISKTFTYIAAMQLVEQGRLDLDADANRYLPPALRLPDAGYPPVKVRHLMTHTAGFEDSALGHLFARPGTPVPTLDDYLARYRPQRVRAPGVHADYSNYAVALLGAIVQQASGQPFDAYVEQHVLAPLGMTRTTFREPLPANDPRAVGAALAHAYSTGFRYVDGGFAPQPFEHIAQIAPAGAAASSAADMARYMRMLLNGGALDGRAVLRPQTFAAMAGVDFRNAPDAAGIAHGFFRHAYGRYLSLEHGGATLWFQSDMVVLPDAGVGVFVSTNTDTGRELATELPRQIFERFLADARPAALPPARGFVRGDARFAGRYLAERRNYSTLEKLLDAAGATAAVGLAGDGQLVLRGGAEPTRWVQDGPLTFRAAEGGDRLVFLQDARGRISGFVSPYGHTVFDRIGPLDDPSQFALLLGVLALLCIGALVAAWARRGRRIHGSARGPFGATFIVILAALLWLAFIATGAAALAQLGAMGPDAIYAYPTPLLRVAVALAYLCAAVSAIALLQMPAVWRARGWGAMRKLHHSAVVLTMLVAVAGLAHWNVLFAPLALG
ncbi:MAG: serine hydrolase domain-containing protein [Mizugakiibacter sp.]|uniref:serine hydrolase domain-containing protein n=1 Tax=Mizugakiibacter sp. TaxID=1972610 RepID=UPI003210C434